MGASLDDLAAFAAVARNGGFTRAAAALGTSTSNLSHTIRRLEKQLGTRVLQRTSRSVSPTEAGASLLRDLEPALAAIAGALDTIDRGRDRVSGTLRLTATLQAYDAVIRPVLPPFIAEHPEVIIEVLIDTAFRDIVADRLDAGIRLGEKLEQDMIAVRVGADLRMAVVATPGYLAARNPVVHPRDLIDHRCINYRMVGAGTVYAWEFEKDGQTLDVRVSGPLTFNEPKPDAGRGSRRIGCRLSARPRGRAPSCGRTARPAPCRLDPAIPGFPPLLPLPPPNATGARRIHRRSAWPCLRSRRNAGSAITRLLMTAGKGRLRIAIKIISSPGWARGSGTLATAAFHPSRSVPNAKRPRRPEPAGRNASGAESSGRRQGRARRVDDVGRLDQERP